MMNLQGNGVSKGITIGKVLVFKPFEPNVQKNFTKTDSVKKEQIELFNNAIKKTSKELEIIQNSFAKDDPEKAKIFIAHNDILCDVCMTEDIITAISEENMFADYAIDTVTQSYAQVLAKSKNQVIRERVSDMKDVSKRLLRNLYDIKEITLSNLKEEVIIVCEDLFPSVTATMDRKKVIGILTEIGGSTSHSAIIAKSYGIPAILGIQNLLHDIQDEDFIILDAINGIVIKNPSKEQINEYQIKKQKHLLAMQELARYLDKPAKTRDGTILNLGLNIGSANIDELQNIKHVDYVGLFRSEFLYMEQESLPKEQLQFEVYKKALLTAQNKEVVLRTLDIGGDKTLSYWDLPKEDNPFLGCRAIRLCFENQTVFRTQLRAALRASCYGKLSLMFPMIASLDDIRRVKWDINEVKKELDDKNVTYSKTIHYGIMIEIPSIAFISDHVVNEVDFASIGTNDLTQYLLACDRLNPKLNSYYQVYHPALFRLIHLCASTFIQAGKKISVCGELGGDPKAAMVLIGLGIYNLSMNIDSIAPIKKMLHQFTISELKNISKKVLTLQTSQEINDYLENKLINNNNK